MYFQFHRISYGTGFVFPMKNDLPVGLLFLSGHANIEQYITNVGYLGIIIWFLTFDQLTLIPEEVSLITIGYLASKGIVNPFLACLVSVLPLITIDIIYYFLSRSGSKFIQKRFSNRKGFIARYKEKMRTNMGKTILTLCFIPRMRYWCPILIGSMSLPLKRFMLFDGIGLVIFCALYVSLGLAFHSSLQALLSKVHGAQNIIFFGSVGVFAVIITVVMVRSKRKETEEPG